MSTQVYEMRMKLVGLPQWRLLRRVFMQIWLPVYRLLEKHLAGKPGMRGWFWTLFHNRQWQKSSATSAMMWVLGTFIVFNLVERLGYGWEINIGVSLILDLVAYAVHKRWIFHLRQVALRTSCSRNAAIWLVFFVVNFFLSWLVIHHLGFGALYGRSILGCYGIAINPVMFVIRDKGIFSQLSLKEMLYIVWRVVRKAVKV